MEFQPFMSPKDGVWLGAGCFRHRLAAKDNKCVTELDLHQPAFAARLLENLYLRDWNNELGAPLADIGKLVRNFFL